MKYIRTAAAGLAALLLASCVGNVPAPPHDETHPPVTEATTPPAVSTADPQTFAPLHTDPPVTETTPPPETTADPLAHALRADSEAALRAIAADSSAEGPICITFPFVPTREIVIDRPVTLHYLPETVPDTSCGILISTRKMGEIVIHTAAADLLSSGYLTIDAPFCTLVWQGSLPSPEDAALYCNVAAFNGNSDYSPLGGTGDIRVEGISFARADTGGLWADCRFAVRGNVLSFGYPLTAWDADLENATLYFTTNGTAPARTYDLRTTHEVTLTDGLGGTRTYLLCPYRISGGIPVMQICTDENAPILNKTDYVHGVMYIDGEAYPMKIRGRGNASWTTFPKKSYRIKLDAGAPLFGLPKNRDWVLVSNYADKSLIRNCVAHRIAATLTGMEYTSTHFPVNLYLNGEYLGVYTFADKIEEGRGRLDFSPKEGDTPSSFGGLDIGFLIEIGWDFDGENVYNKDFFNADLLKRVYVKEPKSDRANTPEFLYAKNYILAAEQAIVNDDGWENLIDLDSFVDWFILTELTFNTESAFYRSCYLWKREGGRLMMGPVWDFDMAFGNHYGDIRGYDGWCTTESTYQYISENWMNHLITYPAFTDALYARWNEVGAGLLDTALAAIDDYEAQVAEAQVQNFRRWNIMLYQIGAGSVHAGIYNTHAKQVQYLRDFINTRWAYMDARIRADYTPKENVNHVETVQE